MTAAPISLAAQSGTFDLGGDLPVNRLGFGAIQLAGPRVWGEPADPDECVRVLRRAVDLGVNFIDTADSYGPFVSEQLVRKALHPYPDGLVIGTKAGVTRPSPDSWAPVGRPEYLRQQVELSLRHLGLERIDLHQLHRVDPKVPLEDQVGELASLQKEGKILHIGLSEVSIAQIEAAQRLAPIVSVQNRYNLLDRTSGPVLEYCEANGTGFIPWFPLANRDLVAPNGPLGPLAETWGIKPAQLALAWLLGRSRVMLPIPGTAKVAHLEENVAAAAVKLSEAQMNALQEL